MKNPFFSIIIPTYNRVEFLRIAIESVLQQTFDNYELIIIDDGSTDKTKEMIQGYYPDNKKLSYFYQNNQGVSKARNQGIERSKGKFIAFLDSDDRFCRQKLEISYAYIKNNPQYKIFHTQEIWYCNGTILNQKAYHQKPTGLIFSNSLKLCCIGLSTALINQKLFDEVGYFDENLPACEDYDFWLRTTFKNQVFLIPHWLTIKEGGRTDQLSKKYPAMDKFRIKSLIKILKSGLLDNTDYNLAYAELKNKFSIYTQGALKRGKNDEIKNYQNTVDNLAR